MNMRPSRVLRKLRAGLPVSCTKFNTLDPRVLEIACAAGFDCAWLDNEHTPMDWHECEHLVRTAKLFDTDTVVRVARGSYSDHLRPLELDATGIMVPHVMTAAEAQQLGRMTRFHPIGRRPLDGGNTDGAYCQIPVTQYIEQANRERFVIVQIEDPEAIAELDGIAAVPGIDMIFFGPGDYSHALGLVGQIDAPPVQEARLAVAAAARRHGKFAGTTSSPDKIRQRRDEGYQFIACGADVHALSSYYRTLAQSFQAAGMTGVS
jgi:4-hydroxy-2-oxoheptanedioate aldolase